MTEAKWTAATLRRLRATFPLIDIHKVNERIQAGRPDCQCIINGRTIYVEFKGPKTPVTPLQQRTFAKMRRAGAPVYLVRFTGRGTDHTIDDPLLPVSLDELLTIWQSVEPECVTL